ncbi:hypothetical protein HY310_00730 [Candidatus Microgenomates bacterium]|nr:hypothetical protein [Candidatus Microgenomates bacterium]
MIKSKLLQVIKTQFALPINSLHGISHWKHVEVLGRRLATSTEADLEVITLFAYLHDARRINEDFDPEHGERAGQYCLKLFNDRSLPLSKSQLKQLMIACQNHSDSKFVTDDMTVATCLDADKLDLVRFGISPHEDFLLTEAAIDSLGQQ